MLFPTRTRGSSARRRPCAVLGAPRGAAGRQLWSGRAVFVAGSFGREALEVLVAGGPDRRHRLPCSSKRLTRTHSVSPPFLLKAPFQFLSAQTLENVGKDWEDTGGGGRERAPSAAVSAGAFRAMSGRRRTPGPLAGGTSGSEAQAQKGGGSERGAQTGREKSRLS